MAEGPEYRKMLGERLRKIRAEYGKTQREMAAYLGLGDVTWQTYERGLSCPKTEVYSRLSRDGWNVDWIMTGQGSAKAKAPPAAFALREEPGGFFVPHNLDSRKIFSAILSRLSDLYPSREILDLSELAFEICQQVLRIARDEAAAMEMAEILIKTNEKPAIE